MSHYFMRRALLALGLSLLATAVPRSQTQTPPQAPVFRAGVELVIVDVIVVDTAGTPIRGLTADDFTVTLDGQSRPVRALDFLEYAMPPSADEPAPPASRETTNQQPHADRGGRVFLLVFDDLSAKPTEAKGLTLAAERMLATLDDDDLVGMVTTSGLGPLVQPTRDRAAVLAALRSRALIGRNDDNPAPRFFIGVNEAIDIFIGTPMQTLRDVVERECGIPNYDPSRPPLSICPDQVTSDARHLGELTVHRTASQMAAYRAAIAALQRAPKPRIVIALSGGIATSERNELKEQTDALSRAAAEAGTQFYVLVDAVEDFDMRWSGKQLAMRREKAFLNGGAQIAATAAGGDAFLVVGQADRFFTRIQRETSGFYRLGVEAPVGTDRERILNARVAVRRSGATVRSNAHAVVETAAAEPLTVDERARQALAQGGASFGVPVAIATALRRNPHGADLQLGVSVQVPAGVPGPLVAMFALIDDSGRTARDGRAAMAATTGDDYYLNLPVSLDVGRYKLRVVVADASGNIGGVEQPIDSALAHFGHFAVSDLFTGWAAADGVTRFLALETLPAGATTLRVSLELYPDDLSATSSVSVRMSIVPAGATAPIASSDLTPTGNGAARTVNVSLPADQLRPGVYEIRATIIEAGVETGTVIRRVRKSG